jgi:hypothetical protein
MKKIVFLSLLVCAVLLSKAQEPIFYNNDKVFNFGVGLGNSLSSISLSLEQGVIDGLFDKGTVGVGGILGFVNSFNNQKVGITVAARGSFHYPFFDKFDTYAGLALGFRYNIYNNLPNDLIPVGGFYLGGRYYFSDKLAFFAEAGAGIDYLTLGISYKL